MSRGCHNWDRLLATIEWLNMTPNSFAMQIGMARAESLYHIQNGNFGISPDMADRIVQSCPEINRTWLLTGVGNSLVSKVDSCPSIPVYSGNVETILPTIAKHKPTTFVNAPNITDCDIVVHAASESMITPKSSGVMLWLKLVDPDKIRPNTEYVMRLYNKVVWRKVRSVEDYDIVLSPLNNVGHSDLQIDVTDIIQAWEVIVKSDTLI